MTDRPLCPRCLRPEASDEEWESDGYRPHLCRSGVAAYSAGCALIAEQAQAHVGPALAAWAAVPEEERAWVLDQLDQFALLEMSWERRETALRAALALLRAATVPERG